jgi:hypothetical protein
MSDVILVAIIVVFFAATAQLARACSRITAESLDDVHPSAEVLEPERESTS